MKKIDSRIIASVVVFLFAVGAVFTVLGVRQIDWPERNQKTRRNPIVEMLPPKVQEVFKIKMEDGRPRDPIPTMIEADGRGIVDLGPITPEVLSTLSASTVESLRLRYNEGIVKFHEGDTNGALMAFRSVHDIDPQGEYGRRAWIQMGIIHDRIGEYAAAIESLSNAVALNSSDAIAEHDLGLVYLHAGRPADAATHLARAGELDSRNSGVFQNLGNAHVLAGQLDEAAASYAQALDLNPVNAAARFNLGLLQYRREDLVSAEDSFKLADDGLSGTDKGRNLAFLGMTQYRRGALDAAGNSFARAADADTSEINYRFNEAVVWGLIHKRSEAVGAYQEVIQATPMDTYARFGLAGVHFMGGDHELALAEYEAGLLIDSSASGPVFTVGFIYFQKGEIPRAELFFKHVVELGGPDVPRARVNLGLCYEMQNRLEDAAREYEMGDQADPRTFYNLGLVRRKLGQLDEAIKAFDRAYEIAETVSPEEIKYPIALADAYLEAGRPDAAIASYEAAVQKAIGNFDVLIRLARLTTQLEKLPDAARWIEQALAAAQTPQERALALLAKGLLADRHGDIEGSLRALNDALLADKANADIYYNLGVIYSRQARHDEAVQVLRTAVQINPDHSPAFTQLGNLFYSRGLADEAAKAYREAVRIDSSAIDAAYNLKMIERS